MVTASVLPDPTFLLDDGAYSDVQYEGQASAAFCDFTPVDANTCQLIAGPTVNTGDGDYTCLDGDALADYEVVIDYVTGTLSGANGEGTYPLDVLLHLRVNRGTAGTKTCIFTAKIQRADDPGVWLEEAEFTLTAQTSLGPPP